jgi:propionyl-CoA carboxylase alpha chain
VRWPGGEGIRTDAAVTAHAPVSPAYDSLVAKVMAHGDTRAAAIAKLDRAVRALELDGLETNRDLLGAVLTDGTFVRGEAGVDYLDGRPDLRGAALPDEVRQRHAAAAGFALLEVRARQSLVPVPAAGWRNVGTALHADELTDATGTLAVRAPAAHVEASVLHGGEWVGVSTAATSDGVVDLTTGRVRRRYRVRLSAHGVCVNGPEGQSSWTLRTEDDVDDTAGLAGECRAPLPGAVTSVLVAVGDPVSEGDGLIVLEAMKMEHTLRASGSGTVSDVLCTPGQQVDVGDVLVVVGPA